MRLIDADALQTALVDEYSGISGYKTREKFYQAIEIVRRQPTIAPPPNAPLTLDELREMDGEPVWITDIVDGISTKEYWALIFSVEEDSICFSTKECGDDCRVFRLYENTWLAYRRKPEEGDGIGS